MIPKPPPPKPREITEGGFALWQAIFIILFLVLVLACSVYEITTLLIQGIAP